MAVTEKLHATTSRAIGTDSSWIFHIRSTAWSVLDPLLFSFYTCTVGKVIYSLFFILLLCWWDSTHPPLTFLRLSLNHISACISACLADLSPWMAAHHLKLNLSKTELLYIPGRALCPNLRKLPGELIQSDHTSWQCMQPLCSSGQSDNIRRIQLFSPQRPLCCFYNPFSLWVWITATSSWQLIQIQLHALLSEHPSNCLSSKEH